ncbi:MAG TPA: pyridoxal-phosphate dependent enzyme, partial [Hellea balneolensis]|nr:pyridoxal-phosphate dependent enzyme [Hellea balneolensis]
MRRKKPGRGKVYNSITETIGDTPLVRLPKISQGIEADLLFKLEFFNPAASVKDRIGLAMIEDLERRHLLKPGGIIVEPTSGNTGIGLALAAAAKGYKAVFTMPESMSVERRKLMGLLGAEIILTPAGEGMPGAIKKADELTREIKGAV